MSGWQRQHRLARRADRRLEPESVGDAIGVAVVRHHVVQVQEVDVLEPLRAKRLEIATSGDREVQRTLMQLLAELDGFNPLGEVKIIGATNRPDILDDALLRPGRFDRIIEIPLPGPESRMTIFKIHTRKMSVARDVDFGLLASRCDGATGADIHAICTEAGMFAIREDRETVTMADFERAIEKVIEDNPVRPADASGAMYA